ncbi:MAG TPA: ABC transporter substrate-binding protein [Candidatus Dormibacteraeota bacterium]|nr:ABC transporter substrate-binding protein [Candidatus Dormibacteraeota bacterium]
MPQFVLATANNMNHLPEFVGVEKGIFVKHGIDLKLKVLGTGAETMRAFQSGNAQFMTVTPTTMAAAYNAGVPLKAVVVIMGNASRAYYDDMLAVTARKGSGIRPGHPEDLAGKRVGMVVGGTGEAYLRDLLAAKGVDPTKVSFVNVPPSSSVSAMRTGAIDAESTWEPYGTMILKEVPGSYLVDRGGKYLGYGLYIATSDAFIASHPKVIQELTDAFAESEAYVRRHPHEAAMIATRWIEGLTPAEAETAIKYMDFDPRFSVNTLQAANREQDQLLKLGRIHKLVDFTKEIDTKYVAEAMRTEPQAFSDLKPVKAMP